MPTLAEIYTFLEQYFGKALSEFFEAFVRKAGNKPTMDTQKVAEAPDGGDASPVSSTPSVSAESIHPSPSELLSSVVADNIALPSLPSILLKPEARPPLEVKNDKSNVQDFGPPSNVFHDRRTALGCITNIPGENVKVGATNAPKTKSKTNTKTKAKAKTKTKSEFKAKTITEGPKSVINYSLPTSARRHDKRPRSRSRAAPEVEPCIATTASEVPSPPVRLADTTVPAPAPCSPGWNEAKVAVIAEMRGFSKQVASRRHSMPVFPSVPTSDTATVRSKRHSAPSVLVASSGVPKVDIEALLSRVMCDAQDTLTVLDKEKGKIKSEDIEVRPPPFSAIAVKSESDIFVIGELTDDDEEEEEDKYYSGAGLPIVNPACETPIKSKSGTVFGNFTLVASISASRSMAELADASSRSISDLLDRWDKAMRSPKWARILSRWDGVTRRNDSVV